MQKWPFAVKQLTIAVAAMGFLAPFAVQAAPVTYGNYTIDAEYILGASSGQKHDGMSDSDATVNAFSGGADYFLWKYQGQDGTFFHTYGYEDGYSAFGARASGDGSFFARTSVNYRAVFTNTSATARNFNFTFGVQEGELGINGSGAAVADLLLRIRINGVDIARDHTTFTQDALGQRSCASDDLGMLGNYMGCAVGYGNSIIAVGRNYTLDLGLIGAGESFTLDYDIVSTAYGDLNEGVVTYSYYVCDEWEGGWIPMRMAGDGDSEQPVCLSGHYETESMSALGGAIARSGDPLNPYWRSANINGSFVGANSVPEPSSMALLGLAVAGLGAVRRRQAQRG